MKNLSLRHHKTKIALALMCNAIFITPTYFAFADTSAWTYSYDANGYLESKDGPRSDVGDITSYTYDSNGNIQTVTNALNQVTTFNSYNSAGQPLSITDPNGITSLFEYNSDSLLTKETVVNPIDGNRVIQYTYYLNGLLKDTIVNGNTIRHFEYEGKDLVAVTNGLGDRKEYSLDLAGNHTSQILKDSFGNITYQATFVFDELSRMTEIIGNHSQQDSTGYDANGNPISFSNARLALTERRYDALNRVHKIIDPDEKETDFTYDTQDRVRTVTDARGNTTTYTFDGLGNLLFLDSPDTGLTSYLYDNAGNRTHQTDSRGAITGYTYDALNRLATVTYPSVPAENVTYQYDSTANGNRGIGHVTGIIRADHQIAYTYNTLGMITSKNVTTGGTTTQVQYRYNATGQLTTIIYPSGREVEYTYDTLGRASSIATRPSAGASMQTLVSGVSYLPFGPARTYTYGNGLSHESVYDLDYRLESIEVGSINPLLSRNYFYDITNNITGLVDGVDDSKSQNFDYDLLDRLIGAEGSYGQLEYAYDALGNRQSETRNSTTDIYTYDDESNLLESISSISGNRSFTYDNAGNRTTQNGNTIYTYNQANRLTSVNVNGNITQYTYNPLGQRILKSLAGGQQENYYYDEVGQLIAVQDASGQTMREYVYWDNQPVALITQAVPGSGLALYYIHNDHQNVAQVITNAAQQVVWIAHYEPFGNITQGQNTVIEHFSRFPGQYVDHETGLYYNYFRDYDPSLGRYLQSDPIGLEGGINTYAYVGGNPLSFIDPKGQNAVAGGAAAAAALCLRFSAQCAALVGALYCSLNPQACIPSGDLHKDASDDVDSDGDDCGCWKILERRNSWWDGDQLYWEYQECLRNCKDEKKPCVN